MLFCGLEPILKCWSYCFKNKLHILLSLQISITVFNIFLNTFIQRYAPFMSHEAPLIFFCESEVFLHSQAPVCQLGSWISMLRQNGWRRMIYVFRLQAYLIDFLGNVVGNHNSSWGKKNSREHVRWVKPSLPARCWAQLIGEPKPACQRRPLLQPNNQEGNVECLGTQTW